MELILRQSTPDHPTPESCFADHPDFPAEVRQDNQLMLDLLAHLRQEVPGPALLVNSQMSSLWFTHSDLGGYIRIEAFGGRYEIARAAPRSWSHWRNANLVSFATTAAAVTQKLFAAFEHQPTPQEWKQDMLYPEWDTTPANPHELRTFTAALRTDAHQGLLDALYQGQLSGAPPRRQEQIASLLHLLSLIDDQTSRMTLWTRPTPGVGVLLSQMPTDAVGVTIQAGMGKDFLVSYPFRSTRAPWSDAILQNHAKNAAEAVHLIVVGMEHIIRSAPGKADGA